MTEPHTPDGPATDETAREPASGLDAGGHEPAPPSEDPGADEARDAIQDAFNDLEAIHAANAPRATHERNPDEATAPEPDTEDQPS